MRRLGSGATRRTDSDDEGQHVAMLHSLLPLNICVGACCILMRPALLLQCPYVPQMFFAKWREADAASK